MRNIKLSVLSLSLWLAGIHAISSPTPLLLSSEGFENSRYETRYHSFSANPTSATNGQPYLSLQSTSIEIYTLKTSTHFDVMDSIETDYLSIVPSPSTTSYLQDLPTDSSSIKSSSTLYTTVDTVSPSNAEAVIATNIDTSFLFTSETYKTTDFYQQETTIDGTDSTPKPSLEPGIETTSVITNSNVIIIKPTSTVTTFVTSLLFTSELTFSSTTTNQPTTISTYLTTINSTTGYTVSFSVTTDKANSSNTEEVTKTDTLLSTNDMASTGTTDVNQPETTRGSIEQTSDSPMKTDTETTTPKTSSERHTTSETTSTHHSTKGSTFLSTLDSTTRYTFLFTQSTNKVSSSNTEDVTETITSSTNADMASTETLYVSQPDSTIDNTELTSDSTIKTDAETTSFDRSTITESTHHSSTSSTFLTSNSTTRYTFPFSPTTEVTETDTRISTQFPTFKMTTTGATEESTSNEITSTTASVYLTDVVITTDLTTDMSTMRSETTYAGTVAACLDRPRPNVGLNEPCGEHSVDGKCSEPGSICKRPYEWNTTIWECRCSNGFIQTNVTCTKVPDGVFMTKEKTVTTSGNFTEFIEFEQLRGFDLGNQTYKLAGRCENELNTTTFENGFLQGLIISNNLPLKENKCNITVIVRVFIHNMWIADFLHLTLEKVVSSISKHILILDGTPENTIIGQLMEYSNIDIDLFNLTNEFIDVTKFGMIRTVANIIFDDMVKENEKEIFFSDFSNVYYNGTLIGVITVTFVRTHFPRAPIPEHAFNETIIGSFNSSDVEIIHEGDFEIRAGELLLGSTELNYTKTKDFNKTITFRVIDKQFNVSIIFQIIDINDNAPYYLEEPYVFQAPPSVIGDVVIGAVQARDIDSSSTLRYSISHNDKLAINDLGTIMLKSSITESEIIATVNVTDGTYTTTTYITILSRLAQQEHLGLRFTGTVKENEHDRHIANVFVNGYENFKLFESQARMSFALDSTTGDVKNTRKFDRENSTERKFEYTIIANKQGQKCSPVVVGDITVTVEDVNDNAPQFGRQLYWAEIEEGDEQDRDIKMTNEPIRTTDKDVNQSVTFSISTETAYHDLFKIDKSTGMLRTNASIDRENITQCVVLTVLAYDGIWTSNTSVYVTILDINDNSPVFRKYAKSFSVFENETSGSNVSSVLAVDDDDGSNGKVRYEMVPMGHFQIDRVSGEITVGVGLDREKTSMHKLTIFAKDQGNPVKSASVIISVEVIDVNDENPEFSENYRFENVSENHNCAVPVIYVTATDKDDGVNGEVTYKIETKASLFKIDESSGAIRCSQSLDYETSHHHYLVITATDNGFPKRSATQTVDIQVTDVNDNTPTFINPTHHLNLSYFEPTSSRIVYVVQVVDLDSGDNGRISYNNLTGNASYFLSINDYGVIKTRVDVKPESDTKYVMNVSVNDNGYPQKNNSTTIYVIVKHDEENQQLIKFKNQEITMFVEENNRNGTELESVKKDVNDTKCNMTFEILDESVMFSIDNTDGTITALQAFDRERNAEHRFVVRVRHNMSSDLALVRVQINDTNDNSPVFIGGTFHFRVNEREDNGFSVRELSATDADEGDNAVINFTMSQDTECKNKFDVITVRDGVANLTLVEKIDREQIQSCKFNVTAFNPNNESMSMDTIVYITILDDNDHAPEFHGHNNGEYTVSIYENATSNTEIDIEMKVTDKDERENAEIKLFVNGTCWLKFETYFVNQTAISVKMSVNDTIELDFEEGVTDNVCIVVASDNGTPPQTTSVTINIKLLDVNDNPPTVDNDIEANISRYTDIGYVLTRVNATDKDSAEVNQGILFKVVDSVKEPYFRINETSGEIRLNSSIKNVDSDTMFLDIIVSDRASNPMSSTVQVKINIVDGNRAPFFKNNSTCVTIQEHSIPYYDNNRGDIGRLLAFDIKDGDNTESECKCVYNMTNERDDIQIHNITGVISFKNTSSTFDREKEMGLVTLNITVTDDGTPPRTNTTQFQIIITDINDQYPVFEKAQYEFTISENLETERIIGSVSATDLDENPITNYSIEKNDLIKINHSSGEIYVTGKLKEGVDIKGIIRATDLEDSSKNDTAILKVLVDTNKHSPTFTKDQYFANLTWNEEPNKEIIQVTANDNDTDRAGEISYSILHGNTRSFFRINNSTGWINLWYALDSSVLEKQNSEIVYLTVEAKDNGILRKSSTATVSIKLFGENPGECVSGTEHSKKVHGLEQERLNWSYALYGLSGALSISIFTTLVFLYKWRSVPDVKKSNQQKDDRNHRHGEVTKYEDLNKMDSVMDAPYSRQSNHVFRNRWNEVSTSYSGDVNWPRTLENRTRWESTEQLSNHRFENSRHAEDNRFYFTNQHADLRLILENDSDGILDYNRASKNSFPDHYDEINEPLPDYD